MLLARALLLSCLSLRSSSAILAFDVEAAEFCTDECDGRTDNIWLPCNNNVTGRETRRACDMKGSTEVFRINANDKATWDVLSVTNASTVELEATKLVRKIYLKSVPSVVLDSSRTQSNGFSYLSLEDCQISEEYTMSFGSLKELHIVSSKIGVIMQTSMNEIDILNESRIKKLSAGIEKSRSTFRDSTLDKIEMLHINGVAKIVMTNMTINDVQNLKYSSNVSSTVSSSYIEKITSLNSQPSSGELKFDKVEVREIVSNGVTIMGKVKITNSVIHESPIDGILISGSGEITFSNVTINGVQMSYTLKADPSSNATVTALHLSVLTFPYSIVCRVIIALQATVIAVLLCFSIKQVVAKRNLKASDDPENKNLESNDLGNITANCYTKNIKSEDIPMATRNEPGSTGQAAIPESGGSASQELTPPHLSESQNSFDVSQLPLPHPQMLHNCANTPQPLYDDIEGGQSDTKNSFLYKLVKTSVGQKKNFIPSTNAKTSWQANPALFPEVSSHAPGPMLAHQIANPASTPTALPVPSPYATRGQVKPAPPPRNPPTHRQISQSTGVHGLPPVQFHPTPAANLSDYQDTVPEEPLYASEDELKNY